MDGLILLSAGAGGQTGWANPFAFVRAVRQFFDGTIVLAGGIADGVALRAARTLGADLGYMGTRFIAAAESAAPVDYRQAVVDASMDDVVRSDVVGGIPASLLRAWLTTHQSAGPTTDGFDHRRLKTNSGAGVLDMLSARWSPWKPWPRWSNGSPTSTSTTATMEKEASIDAH